MAGLSGPPPPFPRAHPTPLPPPVCHRFALAPAPSYRFDATFDRMFYEGALGIAWEGTAHLLSPTSSTSALVAEWAALSAVDVSRVCTQLGTWSVFLTHVLCSGPSQMARFEHPKRRCEGLHLLASVWGVPASPHLSTST